MKNKNAIKRTLLSVTLVLGLFSGGLAWLPEANAEGVRDKWYLGGGFGRTFSVDDNFRPINYVESDNVFNFIFGYHIFKYLAIEGGIVHLNRVEGKFLDPVIGGTPYTGLFASQRRITGIEATVVWHLPFWKSETRTATFYLKGGTFTWDDTMEVNAGTVLGVAKDSGTDITAGFGVQIRGEGNAAFRFAVQRYEIDQLTIDTTSINFLYYF